MSDFHILMLLYGYAGLAALSVANIGYAIRTWKEAKATAERERVCEAKWVEIQAAAIKNVEMAEANSRNSDMVMALDRKLKAALDEAGRT